MSNELIKIGCEGWIDMHKLKILQNDNDDDDSIILYLEMPEFWSKDQGIVVCCHCHTLSYCRRTFAFWLVGC